MLTYSYDIECFKNLFTATFINVEDDDDIHVFCVGMGKDDVASLKKFLSNEITLVGYNSISYDDPMLRFIIGYRGQNILKELYVLSGMLVSEGFKNEKKIISLRYPKERSRWSTIDLMKLLAFDKIGISLKQTAINLKWPKIQDLPLDPNATVPADKFEMVLAYNKNDVLITKKLYWEIKPLRELRDNLGKIYHIDFSSASDSKVANLILEEVYAKELHTDMSSIRSMRTNREKLLLGDCIAPFVSFKTGELRELYDRVSATIVYKYNGYKYLEKINFANCTFTLGIGGLHSEDAPGKFISDDEYLIQDMDVASYYPNLIINNKFYPEHLGEGFITVLKKITDERLKAKHSGDKVKADGLKITINSIFGKMGSEYFWLLDAKQLLSTTLTGQFGLLMLIEELHMNGIQVISCNTDGIVCRINRKMLDKYYEITKEWEAKTNLQLEFTPYKKYIRRDVNTYITEKEDGSTKEKGAFLKEVDLKKSYHMPIVAKALYAYFIKDIPVSKTIRSADDIMEFCISQKTGSNFKIELHTTKGIQELQKTNRFYISKKGGALIKRDYGTSRTSGLYVGKLVTVLNDFEAFKSSISSFKDYMIDYAFYEKEAQKTIDEIEPVQMTLFDVQDVGNSWVSRSDFVQEKEDKKDEKLSLREINKLGRIQFMGKINSVVYSKSTIEGISSRYAFVMDFNEKKMTAELYSLNKGTSQTVLVDKDFYDVLNLRKWILIYCSKFDKTENGEYILTEYKIVEKLENTEMLSI